jgi:hypothetical protein
VAAAEPGRALRLRRGMADIASAYALVLDPADVARVSEILAGC